MSSNNYAGILIWEYDHVLPSIAAVSYTHLESELEQIYQVSRTTIRKAVKMLSDEGFLSVRQLSLIHI